MAEAALREGTLALVYPLGVNLVLTQTDEQVHALAGNCPHMGCPLFMGTIDGQSLTCAYHDWRFAPDVKPIIDTELTKTK